MLARDHWSSRIEQLDPETDYAEINRILTTHEFPWDTVQALSFPLFRTYAVPSIGDPLHDTGEFTDPVQKRYDDTGLLLDEILEHGTGSPQGRAAVRRISPRPGASCGRGRPARGRTAHWAAGAAAWPPRPSARE